MALLLPSTTVALPVAESMSPSLVRQRLFTPMVPSAFAVYSAVVSPTQLRWKNMGKFAISYHIPA
ncbi:hypothetical protein D3C77_772650 [compost metagenome]